jgi:hypothetical protein
MRKKEEGRCGGKGGDCREGCVCVCQQRVENASPKNGGGETERND